MDKPTTYTFMHIIHAHIHIQTHDKITKTSATGIHLYGHTVVHGLLASISDKMKPILNLISSDCTKKGPHLLILLL